MLSRRRLLVAGVATTAAAATGGLVAVEAGWLPGRFLLARTLGRCAGAADLPAGPGPEVRMDVLASAHRGRDVPWALVVPPGVPLTGLPVVLVLHGRGGGAQSAFVELGLHHTLARHTADGGQPVALAAPYGGDTYWHPRANGDDPLGMLGAELLPLLGDLGLAVDRIGVWGWSMGGFGALLVARQSERAAPGGIRVAAAAAASPALFDSYETASSGAFDDPADFARWGDLLADPGVTAATPLRVSCGDLDPYTDATRRYRAAVQPTPDGAIDPGCHDAGYWSTEAAAALSFLAGQLAG